MNSLENKDVTNRSDRKSGPTIFSVDGTLYLQATGGCISMVKVGSLMNQNTCSVLFKSLFDELCKK